MRVAISGASGLIGSALSGSLTDAGHEVWHLVRRQARTAAEVSWDPAGGRVDVGRLDGVDAVVHLAGSPMRLRRWTPAVKREIRDSRVGGTRTLATALARMDRPVPRLLSASGIDYYGDTGGATVDERAPQGKGFLAEVVADWEAATGPAERAGVLVTHLRTGQVLATSSGQLGTVLPFFRLGAGGRLGGGRQYMSWIALADAVGAIQFLLERPDLTGPVNVCAPEPVTNTVYTRAVGNALGRPTVLAVPGFALRAALGEFADETALRSRRVLPKRLLEAGYSFQYPGIDRAVSDILGRRGTTAGT